MLVMEKRGVMLPSMRKFRERKRVDGGRSVSLDRMAQDTGISKSMLSRLENGERGASYDVAVAIAGYLEATVGELRQQPADSPADIFLPAPLT